MSRRTNQHPNRLVPSDADAVKLAAAAEVRFLRLCKAWLRAKGEEIPIPPDIDGDILRWRKMRIRHRRGDCRHVIGELQSTRNVAQWTVTMNCLLRNQPNKILQWKS